MSLTWMANQLSQVHLRGGLNLQVPRYNPHPAGVMQPGGAAMDVLAFLQASPKRWFTFNEIKTGTKRTDKSLDWACMFLRATGRVQCSRDEGRNPRYLRYCAAQEDSP